MQAANTSVTATLNRGEVPCAVGPPLSSSGQRRCAMLREAVTYGSALTCLEDIYCADLCLSFTCVGEVAGM